MARLKLTHLPGSLTKSTNDADRSQFVVRFGVVLIAIAALVAYRVGGFIRYPFADGDLFWQRWLGDFILTNHFIPRALGNEVFSAVGAPWIPHEWIYSIGVALAFEHDALWVLTTITGVLIFASLALLAWRSMKAGTSSWAVVIAIIFAAISIAPNFGVRAEVFAWFFFAIALVILDCDGPLLWALVPLTILWANFHGSATLVVPTMWLNALVSVLQKRKDTRTRLMLCAALPIALLCTPFGVGLPRYALSVLHSPVQAYIAGWKPLPFQNIYVRFGYVPLTALLLLGAFRRVWAQRPFDFALASIVGLVSLFGARYMALFGLAAILPVSLALRGVGPAQQRKGANTFWLAIEGIAVVVVVSVFGSYSFIAGTPGVHWPGPFNSATLLEKQPGEHRLFCAEYSWCAVALGRGNTRVFLDGRADPFPQKIWQAYGDITHARSGWQQLLDDYGVNAIIAWRGGYFESQVQTLPNWSETSDTGDPCCVLFDRIGSSKKKVIWQFGTEARPR